VLAVFELNESGVRFILVSEEDLRHLVAVADPTLGRTRFSADADTRMTARQPSGTGLITSRSVAGLVAQPATAEVWTGPETRLAARVARSAALLRTTTVVAPVQTRSSYDQ